jgi:diguanylate cyclase (GGDEF)-like protein
VLGRRTVTHVRALACRYTTEAAREGVFVVRVRMTISRKFFAVLAVLAPLIVAVAIAGVTGLASMRSEFNRVFGDNIHTSQVSTRLGADLSRAEGLALRLATAPDSAERRGLNATLDRSVVPAVDEGLAELRALHANDALAERAPVARLVRAWSQFVALRDTGVIGPQGVVADGLSASNRLSRQIAGIFDPLSAITQMEASLEAAHAAQAYARAVQTYDTSRLIIWAIAIGAFVLGVGSMLLLTRNVVPRIRDYSHFASAVAAGDLSGRLASRGSDELATLGRALNEMVEQREFVDTLQVTKGEELAHDLLKRQVERSITGSSVVVLNRNNSDDRLEATTALREDSSLKASLTDAKPSSCLAVLFGRPHSEDPDHEPLTHCVVCGRTERRTTCEPLLVGGEVIGSVLVEHSEPLHDTETTALRESVSQAAPVLANLRNLALAEFRASTDGLTGLPNKRAVKDAIKRLAAQASRSLAPLSAVVLDLDHFKQINDSFGHGRGDDVLAAVGAVLSETVRTSDFVGRNGGEEFIVLLPDTDADRAIVAAEKIRAAITQISVAGVEREITISLGIASIPQHAGDGDQLVRSADRALYVAKTNGRNRTEIAVATYPHEPEHAPVAA